MEGSTSGLYAATDRRSFAHIAAQLNQSHMGTVLSDLLKGCSRLIATAVVHDQDFIGPAVLIQIGDDTR